MNSFLLYLIKSTLILSLLYLAFSLLMRKETFFKLNRMVLIMMVLSSMLIPFIQSPQLIQPFKKVQLEPVFQNNRAFEENIQPTAAMNDIQLSTPIPETTKPVKISLSSILEFVYSGGVMVSILLLIYSIGSVLFLFRKARKTDQDGIHLMIVDNDVSAFSFWRYLLISQHDFETNSEAIITHELSHIRMGHFYDLMLMELAKIIFWFNPLIYKMVNDLKEIHEFQADDHTLTSGIDATKYQLLIIQKSVGTQRFALANSFNHCQIKNRITMMNKQKTSKAGLWKVATFLPLLALLLMAFGKEGENVPMESQSEKTILIEEQTTAQDPTAQPKEEVYFTAEVMAEFPGGDKALKEYIAKSVKYPKEAEAKGTQGKVFVTFIVNSQGKVVNPKIARGVAPALDAEALRVVQSMPTWMPGKNKGVPVSLSYTVPILFTLGDHSKTKANDLPNQQKVKDTSLATVDQSIEKLKNGIPPPPPPRVIDMGLLINLVGENIQVNNQTISFDELGIRLNDIKTKDEFVEIRTNSATNKNLTTQITDLLEKRNIGYRIVWQSK